MARELDGNGDPASLMGELRSSGDLPWGALLTRMGGGGSCVSTLGAANWARGPIDLHLGRAAPAGEQEIREEGAASCAGGGKGDAGAGAVPLPAQRGGPQGASCWPPCGCPGRTTLVGAAQEPEIKVDLQEGFLEGAMGAARWRGRGRRSSP